MGRSARRVGEGAGAHHGEDPRSGVPELEVLVRELGAVDGFAAGAVAAGEVTSLAHEVGDDAVEGGPLVGERLARASHPFLARAQRAEVLARPGHHIRAELERDASDGRAADAHVEVTSRQRRHRVRRADVATPRARICVVADDGISGVRCVPRLGAVAAGQPLFGFIGTIGRMSSFGVSSRFRKPNSGFNFLSRSLADSARVVSWQMRARRPRRALLSA